jgi:hypothetical protein
VFQELPTRIENDCVFLRLTCLSLAISMKSKMRRGESWVHVLYSTVALGEERKHGYIYLLTVFERPSRHCALFASWFGVAEKARSPLASLFVAKIGDIGASGRVASRTMASKIKSSKIRAKSK